MPETRLRKTRDAYLPPRQTWPACRDCERALPLLVLAVGDGMVPDRGALRRLGWDLDANDQWVCPVCLASDVREQVLD
jgi:hypothetical protein